MMKIKSIIECESKNAEKLTKLQLPSYFKKIGIIVFVISFISLFANAFTINNLVLRGIIKYGVLLGLLIISISKEKIEDELVTKLRMQSYSLAFITGVFFTLIIPFIDYLFDFFSNKNAAILKDMGDWQILWILLSVQVFYYEYLKKSHK